MPYPVISKYSNDDIMTQWDEFNEANFGGIEWFVQNRLICLAVGLLIISSRLQCNDDLHHRRIGSGLPKLKEFGP